METTPGFGGGAEDGPVAEQETHFSGQRKHAVADTSFTSTQETGRQHLSCLEIHTSVFTQRSGISAKNPNGFSFLFICLFFYHRWLFFFSPGFEHSSCVYKMNTCLLVLKNTVEKNKLLNY